MMRKMYKLQRVCFELYDGTIDDMRPEWGRFNVNHGAKGEGGIDDSAEKVYVAKSVFWVR